MVEAAGAGWRCEFTKKLVTTWLAFMEDHGKFSVPGWDAEIFDGTRVDSDDCWKICLQPQMGLQGASVNHAPQRSQVV